MVHGSERWLLIGAKSRNSIIVRGGDNPVAIKVSHHDSQELLDLLRDANDGVEARRAANALRPHNGN